MPQDPAGWAVGCFVPDDPDVEPEPESAAPVGAPAPKFVGLDRAAVDRLAGEGAFRVVVVGKAGRCIPWSYGLVLSRHLYIAVDGQDVVVAARADWVDP